MTCPGNPPTPAGYKIWRGSVPAVLTQWAMDLRDHIGAHPYGTMWTMSYGGQDVMARKDYHTWTYRAGQLVQGICIPGITLYAPVSTTPGLSAVATADDLSTPDPTAAAFGADDLQQTNWRLVATSAVVTATIVGLFWLGLRNAGRIA